MKDFEEKMWQFLAKLGLKRKEAPAAITEMYTVYEINLVPEIKHHVLQAMRFRNLMIFVCAIVMALAGSVLIIISSILGGQSISMSSQDERLSAMSKLLNDWDGLEELLTIQNQLAGISEATANKTVLSRVFSVLASIIPDGPDEITLSELSVNVSTSTLSFDAQADAKTSPYIDYRVLESFKKGVALMHFDYGRYVDEDGNEIPTRCIVETDADGNTLSETDKSGNTYIYAYWLKGARDCDPNRDDTADEEEGYADLYEDEEEDETVSSSLNDFLNIFNVESSDETEEESESEEEEVVRTEEEEVAYQEYLEKIAEEFENDGSYNYMLNLIKEQYESGIDVSQIAVEKIYRTPNFSKWYEEGYLDTGGGIDGIAHFESECIAYSGDEMNGTIYWTQDNDCTLINDDNGDGIVINNSANGKDSDGSLVLTFSATIILSDDIFDFNNKHMLAISAEGKNVTDSYLQIEGMFAERAAECTDEDVVCTSTEAKNNTSYDE